MNVVLRLSGGTLVQFSVVKEIFNVGFPTMSHHSAPHVTRKKVTIRTLHKKKRDNTPITMLTAYDYSSALHVEAAEIDMILVGDSLGNVVLGRNNTTSVTIDEIIHHAKAVMQGVTSCFVVGDMPYLSYHVSAETTIANAGRILKETGIDAVKIEGGKPFAQTVVALTNAGIPVVGHVGLTPQTLSQKSGHRIQGRTATTAYELYQDCLALQTAGCIAIVFELVPGRVAEEISKRLTIPTIGIGAGAGCDGQVLVYHDMTGLLTTISPKFLKRYTDASTIITDALKQYRDEVITRTYPAEEHTHPIKDPAYHEFLALLGNE